MAVVILDREFAKGLSEVTYIYRSMSDETREKGIKISGERSFQKRTMARAKISEGLLSVSQQ